MQDGVRLCEARWTQQKPEWSPQFLIHILLLILTISKMDIIIDTEGEVNLLNKNSLIDSENEYDNEDDNDDEYDDELLDYDPTKCENISTTVNDDDDKSGRKESKIKSNNDIDIEDFENDMGWNKVGDKKNKKPEKTTASTLYSESLEKVKKELKPIDELLNKKSVIKAGFENLESVPIYELNRKRLAAQRRRLREKTKGKKWFDLPAPEMTDEIKRDLEVIQMRSVLDPKHFYKKNDLKVLPKYFQIGKVVDSPIDYYNNRLTNKERKKTIVDELMADAEFSKYNKRKYKEIVDDNRKKHYKSFRHSKKLKGKKNK